MGVTRRGFLKTAGIGVGAAKFCGPAAIGLALAPSITRKTGKFTFRFRPYELQLKHTFTISGNSRTTTAVMLTELEYEGITGFGEASMPPYLGESHATATEFLSKIRLDSFSDPFRLEEILSYIDALAPQNFAAKASFDIALHDLLGKILNRPWYKLWGLSPENSPLTSFTIGIDTEEIIRQKVQEASIYKILKVKLGRDTDKMMINTIRSATNVPICVDVNQGWKDRQMALDMIFWLKEKGIVFIEQPMPKEQIDDMAWLTQHSPLPTIADEFLQRFPDVKRAYQVYSGINIKLMKSTGMREAYKMLLAAKALNMKIMIGCMTETSCGTSAASQLAPIVNWADLDGNLLISNDIFEGMKVVEGKVTLSDLPGIGIRKKS